MNILLSSTLRTCLFEILFRSEIYLQNNVTTGERFRESEVSSSQVALAHKIKTNLFDSQLCDESERQILENAKLNDKKSSQTVIFEHF